MNETVREQERLGTGDLEFLRGGGEMGALIHAYDWSSTPLGNPETWTTPLRTVVRLMLNTGHPMCIFWGEESIFLYNDAYSQSIGPERHPSSLGSLGIEIWSEIWDIIGPQIKQVMSGGGATLNENHLVPITRNGRREDVYWTYSYSPIDDDSAADRVGGVLVLCTETTAAVTAKQQLKLQMDRQVQLFRKAPGFICILSGPNHVFEFTNDAYMHLLNERDLIGKSVLDAVPEVAAQGFIELLDNVYSSGERYIAYETSLALQRSPDEVEEVFVDFVYEPIRDESGQITGIFVEGHDVTSRTRAEDQQRKSAYDLILSEETLRQALDAANIGTWDLNLVNDTLIWCRRTKAMFGISPDMPCSMVDFYAGIHPDDISATGKAFDLAIDPAIRAIYDVEYRTVGKEDGVIRWVSAKGKGLFNEKDECVRALGTSIDVTKQKNAQDVLVASDARFRFLDLLSKTVQTHANPEDVLSASTRLLGEHLGVDICSYADVEKDGDTFHIRGEWTAPGIPSIGETFRLNDFGPIAAATQRSGVPFVSRNAIAELGEQEASGYTSVGIAATICFPLVKQDKLTAMVAVHSATPRDWPADEISLVREVAERCWAHIERAGAHAALLESEEQLRLILDSAPGAFYSVDAEGATTLVSWGFIELMGFKSYDDVLGVKLHDLIHHSHPDGTHYFVEECPIYQCASTGKVAHIANELFFRVDGSSVPVEYWVSPIIRDGVHIGATCTIIDLTQRNAAEQALRESEQRFRRIADSTPVPMWVTRLDRHRSFVNEAYLAFLGVPYDQALVFDWREIIHPDDHDRIVAESIAGEASLQPFVLEARYRSGNGDWRWLRSESQPRRGEDGNHAGFIGVAHDVTEAKEAEAILRQSEEKFRELFENANDFIFTTDLEMRITSCNPAVARALSANPDELIGRSISRFIPPETWEVNKAMLAAKLAGKGDVTNYEIEVFNHRKERMTWEINSRLIRDATGVPTGLHAIGRDVSERNRAAQLLDEARISAEADAAQQAAVLGQLAEGVIITDASGEIIFVNNAATRLHGVDTLGVAPSEYSKTYNLFREDGSPYPSDQLPLARAVLHGKTARDERWLIQRPDDTVVLAIGNAQPVLDLNGNTLGAVLTVRDDTARHAAELALRELNETLETRVANRTAELEQAQEALRQSQKLEAMGQLTGGVAHDFNNLLTPIIGSLDLLHRKQIGGPREQMMIEGALQSADRAKTLVQRLLAFARRQPLQPTAVDLDKLVAGMADLLSSTLGPHISLKFNIASRLPPAKADANQLEMALLNLGVNARDAMPDAGTLTISATLETVGLGQISGLTPGNYIRLSVADDGTGMDSATLERSIEPFFSTKGIGKGTGLGLSMVHGLASQQGGTMTVDSALGEGTVVNIWLPVTDSVAQAASRPAVKSEPRRFTGTVLLVDDEPIVRASTANMLNEIGFDVIEAGSAEEAMSLFDDLPQIALLITDHLMPGMTGAKFAQWFAGQRPGVPVLIATGYAENDGIPAEMPQLNKPFRQSDLSSVLNGLKIESGKSKRSKE